MNTYIYKVSLSLYNEQKVCVNMNNSSIITLVIEKNDGKQGMK